MTLQSHDLSELALRYTRLFEAAQDGILLLDYPACRIEDANPYLTKLIGYSREELLGKQLWEIGLIADKDKALFAQKTVIDKGYVRYEDIDLVTKSGSRVPVEFISNSYPVDGKTVVQCNIREIGTRKKAEAALALEQSKLARQMYEVIDSLSNVIEARDPYTAGHQKRVADLSVEIAKQMNMSPGFVEGVRFAAQIHDIGKISIPTEILTKPTALNPLEVAMLRSHAQTGYEIVKPLTFPWPVAQTIRQHHERLNGSGYPEGIKDSEICLEAKIIAVADTVESMSSGRPYRPARTLDAALHEISQNSGLLYDRQVVDACLSVFRNQGYHFPSVYSAKYERL